MQTARAIVLALIFALDAAAGEQGVHPRQPVQLPGSSVDRYVGGPSIVTAGDASAVVWVDHSDDNLYVSVSDGRGLSWSSPLRVDEAATSSEKRLNGRTVVMADDYVTMIWGDFRDGSWDVYSNVLHVPTMGLAGEQRVSTTYAPGESDAGESKTGVVNGGEGFGSLVHVVFVEDTEAGDGLYLASSSDYGMHFSEPVPIAAEQFPAGELRVGGRDVAADGTSVYVGWVDNRNNPQTSYPRDVFLQWSDQRGLPGTFQDEPQQVDTDGPGVGHPSGLDLDVVGDTVAVAWHNEVDGFYDQAHCRVSKDGGATFVDEDLVLNQVTSYVGGPKVVVNPTTCAVHVGWIDNSTFTSWGYGFWTRTSTDDTGSFWGAPLVNLDAYHGVTSGSGIWGFAVERSPELDATVSAYWWDYELYDPAHSLRGRIAEGEDAGWSTRFTLAEDVLARGSQWTSVAYNPFHRNFLYAWKSAADNKVTVGGYRPQTLAPAGWEPGVTTVSFSLDRFAAGDDATAWVLMSFDEGDMIELEGKVLGLSPDPLLTASLGLAADGTWAAELDGDGAGTTSELRAFLPAGASLYAVGLGLDLQARTVDVGSITDVMAIEL